MKICPNCKSEYGGGEVFCPVDATRLVSASQLAHPDPKGSTDALVGTTLSGRYQIIRPIGEGGMGIVYEAQHVLIEKRVALKVLRDDFSRRPEVVERFRQEAKSASRIGHEHIVDISDFGETPNGQSYFVMEFLEGEDLANVLAREGTLPAHRAVRIALQCCKALGAAHGKGIVHRDMKPENIFLIAREGNDDFVKIVDFGIAKMSDIETSGPPGRKLTKTGMIFGTPEYMSPEQAAGRALDHRVDVYALGVILFEMLTGRVPFVGDTFMGILTQHMFEEVPPLRSVKPDVIAPDELQNVLFEALAKDPDARFKSMEDYGKALASAMDVSGVSGQFASATVPGYGEPVKVMRRGPRLIDAESAKPSEYPPRARKSSAGLFVGVGAIALLLVVAAIALYVAIQPGYTAASNGDGEIRGGGGDDREAANPPVALMTEEPAQLENGTPAETAMEEEPPRVAIISVDTEPAGARVEVEGRGVVCEASPCSFESPVGQNLRIRARRGAMYRVYDYTPSGDARVSLRLVRPDAVTMEEGGDPGGMMSPMHNDLKRPPEFYP
jgi:eukaryotic-like serine/threonine-protein kinase